MRESGEKRVRWRALIRWGVLSLLLVFLLPLIPYAIQAATDTTSTQSVVEDTKVPSPGGELWRDVRQRDRLFTGKTQVRGVDTGTLINKRGEEWREFRMTKLVPYGGVMLGIVLGLIAIYYFTRGNMQVPGGYSGRQILRFTVVERYVHWVTVGIFLTLALTGLILLYGRFVLIPVLGAGGFSVTASICKALHNYIGPLFVFALLALLITFVKDNFYERGDMKWLSKAGGMFGGHVSAGRFNAGEKIWFWVAVIVGFVLCGTGLVLDFASFGQDRGVMTLAHIIHGISAIIVISVSFGHMYLGLAGMQGSLSSMVNGYVDENWAKGHHDIWYEKVKHTAGPKPVPGGAATGGVSQPRREL